MTKEEFEQLKEGDIIIAESLPGKFYEIVNRYLKRPYVAYSILEINTKELGHASVYENWQVYAFSGRLTKYLYF